MFSQSLVFHSPDIIIRAVVYWGSGNCEVIANVGTIDVAVNLV